MAGKSESSMEEDTASSSESASLPKKATSTKAMEPKAKPTHPSTSEMVIEAITELAERGGSSLFAIKKYIALIYKLDPEKQAIFIKKYLKNAVASGELVQTKGKGASGSFKLPPAKAKTAKLKEAVAAKKPDEKKTSKKAESAKPTSPKKKQASSKVTKKDSSTTVKNAKTAKSAPPKSPKAKKMARSPTTKPKAPKPKKVAAGTKSPKAASKKAVAAKK